MLDALRSLQEQECMCAFVDQACVRCEELTELAESHLLPLTEALEEAIDNSTPGTAKAYHDPPCDECMGCRARKALKALQEALDG